VLPSLDLALFLLWLFQLLLSEIYHLSKLNFVWSNSLSSLLQG